jgi:hypothetical protein
MGAAGFGKEDVEIEIEVKENTLSIRVRRRKKRIRSAGSSTAESDPCLLSVPPTCRPCGNEWRTHMNFVWCNNADTERSS